ncbi:COX assembly mitochondrial protein 2 homolog, partial [Chlorocebus sabaeus]|uniref:COX assembly mitochondrial protein 2 homolog n=1 Tax=Chlorocebus sabaeus TaxID=60711 RepID=UPI003BF9A987
GRWLGCTAVIRHHLLKLHPDLSPHLHTEACSMLINLLKECHENHSVMKFLGHCNNLDWEMRKYLKKEYVELTVSRDHAIALQPGFFNPPEESEK